jgi:hypothetical protein
VNDFENVTDKRESAEDERDPTGQEMPKKRPFVRPEISAAVDVLEATTFFQQLTSGQTNP